MNQGQLSPQENMPILLTPTARPMSSAPSSASYFQSYSQARNRDSNAAFVAFLKNALPFTKKLTQLQVIVRNFNDINSKYFQSVEKLSKLMTDIRDFASVVAGGDPELARQLTAVCSKAAGTPRSID
jgi:oligoendopeptidase F